MVHWNVILVMVTSFAGVKFSDVCLAHWRCGFCPSGFIYEKPVVSTFLWKVNVHTSGTSKFLSLIDVSVFPSGNSTLLVTLP